jgi:ribosomal protein L37AE/L43A
MPDPEVPEENWVEKNEIEDYIKVTKHFDGANQKGSICSAGPWMNFRNKRNPCHGCDIYYATLVKNKAGHWESTRMSKQDLYVFSMFDYGTYHNIEQLDKQGQVKVNSQGQAYLNWTRCPGQRCEACRTNRETKIGHALHWPLNWTHFRILLSANDDVGRSCVTCGGRDVITSMAWTCHNCGECLIDMETTQFSVDDILKKSTEPFTCPHCHRTGFMDEVFQCSQCASMGKEGERATVFDVDLKVKVVVNPTTNNKALQIMDWSEPRPIDPQFAEEAKPLDLVARYTPESLDLQAKMFNVPVKREPVTTGQTAPTAGQPQPGQPAWQYSHPYGNKTA